MILIANARGLPGRSRSKAKFATSVGFLLVLALASEIAGMLSFGIYKETVYIGVRTCLAFSVFFLVGSYVRTLRDVEIVLRSVVLGLVLTSTLMVLSSLPMTRLVVADLVFSNQFLEPAATQLEGFFTETESGIRGRTLVGVSIIGASFINACWPLAALFLRWPHNIGRWWRWLALAACMLAPMGVLMSYSRGPVLGAILIVIAALVLGLRRVQHGILMPVAIGVAIVLAIGTTSQIFFFDRLTSRTAAIFDSPLADERESERLLAYVEPFKHLSEKPRFLLLGEGVAVRYSEATVIPEQAGKATHSAFAIAYYAYGMVAAVGFVALFLQALNSVAGQLSIRRRSPWDILVAPLFLSIVALFPWLALGHAAISTPRGSMLFFFIVGLVSTLAHMRASTAQTSQIGWSFHAQRRHPTV
ncbi:O-antigen ligase family protein [Pontibaca salina]|uniref:O-antigen ligase family protein n=1 Tax=Pontibaca salina TaxID=2795731 RepID=A0A934HTI8_9RHOB|nr:O-antigen ligase family protein [Pontibaca salina]MBI6630255.1 O-antigen ligase family protein [Pontibaca salina]